MFGEMSNIPVEISKNISEISAIVQDNFGNFQKLSRNILEISKFVQEHSGKFQICPE